ncbi:MAG TPA: metallophosphoesterase [Pyrinomonadaceae bacterium]|nr:metallophosphoesterase [Pyrinomonadaceae bacterium]
MKGRFVSVSFIVVSLIIANWLAPVTAQSPNANGSKVSANGSSAAATSPVRLALPNKEGSLRFAAIGDTGTGSVKQRDVGAMMAEYRAVFPFEFVLMMGDNMYGGESADDFKKKFEEPYKELLDAKVKFYASLGNHDQGLQVNYVNFNMNGKEYYRFTKDNVAFYALNSNYMDKKQVAWLEKELSQDTSEWKICFLHHAPYSSAKKHGSDDQLREVVEPIFLKYGVNVVLAGHDHVYERVKPQKGIYYFVSGAGGKLRTGDLKAASPLTDKAYDKDMHFMLFEVVDDQMYFQTISRTGETVDTGVMARNRK